MSGSGASREDADPNRRDPQAKAPSKAPPKSQPKPKPKPKPKPVDPPASGGGSKEPDRRQGDDGLEGSTTAPSAGTRSGSSAERPSRRGVGLDGGAGGIPKARRQEGPHAAWTIVLATFAAEDHVAVAKETRDRLAERLPDFAATTVRSTPRGSMILWGQFSGPDDPAAQAELKRVQAFEYNGARPFAKALLSRPEQTRSASTSPHDLRKLRAANPDVDPLYTLQVAVWADFDGTLSLEEIRRNAEGYAAQLRAKGLEAWFHHDDDLKMSVVTIGAYGADAYDSKSTLYRDDIAALMKKFPKQFVNGEPLMLRLDPRNPRSIEAPQPCMLVLVPPR